MGLRALGFRDNGLSLEFFLGLSVSSLRFLRQMCTESESRDRDLSFLFFFGGGGEGRRKA